MIFFPREQPVAADCRKLLISQCLELGLTVLGFRRVPVDHTVPGPGAAEVEPNIEQIFVTSENLSKGFERKLFVLRNSVSHTIASKVKGSKEFYIASFSSRTIVYKGQLRTEQLRDYFDDL
jgi:glutamate synthase (NADPH/NADH) large chain